jgi:hypothetical protein
VARRRLSALSVAAALAATLFAAAPAGAGVVPVSNAQGLRDAIQGAAGGDEIVLAPGTYDVTGNLSCAAAGSPAAPIVVRAATPRTVLIRFDALEGFRVLASHWRFEGLDIEGACVLDGQCEHAFHLIGNADFTVMRDNVVRDFNAQIKSNGDGSGAFPDDVLVEGNELYDTRARETANPVTKIDVVGGRRWVVRGNTIRDYQKGQGDGISYAAFLKGNSRDGVFERNLVICEDETTGGVRLGLSLGGGGTSAPFCEDGDCTTEHQGGILRNNVILRCPDVGIYLNRAAGSEVHHNTLYDTTGIDVRFATASADLRNNLLSGAIRNRDGATSTGAGNLTGVPLASFAAWFLGPGDADFRLADGGVFVDQGVAAPLAPSDFCGSPRDDGAPDPGAVEYGAGVCDTRVGGGIYAPEPRGAAAAAAALLALGWRRRSGRPQLRGSPATDR